MPDSTLQKIVNSLIKIIVEYAKSQKTPPSIPENLYQQIDQELYTSLERIIKQVGIIKQASSDDNRSSLFFYLLGLIHGLKPLLDKENPLEPQEEELTKHALVQLFATLNHLFKDPGDLPITPILFNRDKVEIKLSSFIYSPYSPWANSLRKAGALVQDFLYKPYNISNEEDATSIIALYMAEHQNPKLKLAAKHLKEQNLSLKNQLQKDHCQYQEQQAQEQGLKEVLKFDLIVAQRQLKQEKAGSETLQKQLNHQQEEKTNLEAQLMKKEQLNTALSQELIELQQTISHLQSKLTQEETLKHALEDARKELMKGETLAKLKEKEAFQALSMSQEETLQVLENLVKTRAALDESDAILNEQKKLIAVLQAENAKLKEQAASRPPPVLLSTYPGGFFTSQALANKALREIAQRGARITPAPEQEAQELLPPSNC